MDYFSGSDNLYWAIEVEVEICNELLKWQQ